MRITSGTYKGRKLNFPKEHPECKPSKERVREAMISIVRPRLPQSHFIDLYTGTAAVALEALSNNAAKVTAVDKDIRIARENTNSLNLDPGDQEKFQLIQADVLDYLRSASSDEEGLTPIINLDPPWTQTALYELTLKAISHSDILLNAAMILTEHPKTLTLQTYPGWTIKKTYNYGRSQLTVFTND